MFSLVVRHDSEILLLNLRAFILSLTKRELYLRNKLFLANGTLFVERRQYFFCGNLCLRMIELHLNWINIMSNLQWILQGKTDFGQAKEAIFGCLPIIFAVYKIFYLEYVIVCNFLRITGQYDLVLYNVSLELHPDYEHSQFSGNLVIMCYKLPDLYTIFCQYYLQD